MKKYNVLILIFIFILSACSSNRYGCKGKRCVQIEKHDKKAAFLA